MPRVRRVDACLDRGGDVLEPAAQIVGVAVGQALRRLRAVRQARPLQAQFVDDARPNLVPVAVPGDLLDDLAGEDVRGVGVVKCRVADPSRWCRRSTYRPCS